MGPLSIRIPIYPGQIPPRGARISKLSLKIWIFRFGRMDPLWPQPVLNWLRQYSPRSAKNFCELFSKVYESGRQRGRKFPSRCSTIPSLSDSLSILDFWKSEIADFWKSEIVDFWKSDIMGLALGTAHHSFVLRRSSFLRGPSGFPSGQLWKNNLHLSNGPYYDPVLRFAFVLQLHFLQSRVLEWPAGARPAEGCVETLE